MLGAETLAFTALSLSFSLSLSEELSDAFLAILATAIAGQPIRDASTRLAINQDPIFKNLFVIVSTLEFPCIMKKLNSTVSLTLYPTTRLTQEVNESIIKSFFDRKNKEPIIGKLTFTLTKLAGELDFEPNFAKLPEPKALLHSGILNTEKEALLEKKSIRNT